MNSEPKCSLSQWHHCFSRPWVMAQSASQCSPRLSSSSPFLFLSDTAPARTPKVPFSAHLDVFTFLRFIFMFWIIQRCDYVWTHTYTMLSLVYTRQGRQTSCVLGRGEETFVNQELHWHQEVSGLLELELVTGGCETPDLIVWELIQVICKNNRCSQALTRLFSAPSEAGPYSKLASKSDPPASIPRC